MGACSTDAYFLYYCAYTSYLSGANLLTTSKFKASTWALIGLVERDSTFDVDFHTPLRNFVLATPNDPQDSSSPLNMTVSSAIVSCTRNGTYPGDWRARDSFLGWMYDFSLG